MSNAYTEDQFVAQRALDLTDLKSCGWVSFTLLFSAESDLRQQLLRLAAQLGTPMASRPSGEICETLMPTKAGAAKLRSLSRIYSDGSFPLHNDTAHWPLPCRYLILACISPGDGGRRTMLLDTQRLPLTHDQKSLLQSVPLRVVNGRNSFFSAILSKTRPFVRFDPGCMAAASASDKMALEVLTLQNWSDHVEDIRWQPGTVLIIDNWRVLHGRGHTERPDPDRKLLRITIQ